MPGGSNLDQEGDKVPPECPFKVDEVSEVHKCASLTVVGLEVAEVVLVLKVDVAALLGAVVVHPSELLKRAQYRVNGAGPVSLVLQVVDQAAVLDLV